MATKLTRRRFLQTTAAAGICGGLLPAADKKPSANERLHVGTIGTAGQAAYDWGEVAKAGAEIVALCDVDERRTADVRKHFPKATFYTDFRKLVEQKGLDAVIVATPDHTHAVATMAALQAGLHVYCEKPLTHTVHEARVVAETAAKHKRVTQMGTQIHAGDNYRRVVELVQKDAIGPVREVRVWCCGKPWGGGERPRDKPPVPAGLHYELWLGPAPYRPYNPTYLPENWRSWWDFGGGTLADMACHYMDLPFWALKLRHPTKVAAEGPRPSPETAPLWLMIHYEFPERGGLPPVKLTWYNGTKRPAAFGEGDVPDWGAGVVFVGEKGMLVADYGNHKLLPEKKFEGFQPPKPFIPRSIGHHREWVEACKSGGATTCNFDYGGALTETVLLGNVAYRLGKPITWDAEKLKANEPEAEKFLYEHFRKPWKL
ncbi:MAG TPA: Gfo/Idh/MocA family oxidoreductase [Gemmataceae bacterium]|jgi:predicted dehydrogenase|nr:Gfo/Idh/MocA family oxidoreductase [Gemmataceae bacterium]